MTIKAKDIHETTPWKKLTPGGEIYEAGTSLLVDTGAWRSMRPIFHEEKCTHCMLCYPFCPDSCIPVINGKRLDFDLMHCKGCGICFKVCPTDAITFVKEEA